MSNNCGCNEEHGKDHDCQCEGGHEDHECNCGCDHDHGEIQTMNIVLEDGTEMKCNVIGVYDINEISYIALVEENDDEVLLYRYEEVEGDENAIDLINIEEDEEFDLASQAFFELFVDEE